MLGHETVHVGAIPSTEDCQINFRSCHDSRRQKIMSQNHTNFDLGKIVEISSVWEDMSTRFLICIWWFCITKRFLRIPFHKYTKISTHYWFFFCPKKAFRTKSWVLGPILAERVNILHKINKFWASDSVNSYSTSKCETILRIIFAKLNGEEFLQDYFFTSRDG